MLVYADVCWRMLTYAGRRAGARDGERLARGGLLLRRVLLRLRHRSAMHALLLLYYCFTTATRAWRTATQACPSLTTPQVSYVCVTTALLMLYYCFTNALLLRLARGGLLLRRRVQARR